MENGHVAVDDHACYNAAAIGDLPMIQWLRARGCPWARNTLRVAALHGNLELLRWARGDGCPWPDDIRVGKEHTETIQWLRVNFRARDVTVC
jgi:hypothetical protein